MSDLDKFISYYLENSLASEKVNALTRAEQVAMLKEFSKVYIDIESTITNQEKEQKDIYAYIRRYLERAYLSEGEKEDLDDKKKISTKLEESLKANYKRRIDLQYKIVLLQKLVGGEKSYDKRQLFQNIRDLASAKSIKLGQIERDAGCQPGYMSRLEKADNLTDPTVEFIVTAAKELEVPIDLLLFGKFAKLSSTEQYIMKFINQLIKDTVNDEQFWVKDNINEFVANIYQNKLKQAPFHPTYHCEYDPYEETYSFSYRSAFLPARDITPVENCYYGDLKGSDGRIYIIHCEEKTENSTNRFFEVYLTRGNNVNPIFCTEQTCDELYTAIAMLYKEIEIAATHVHINEEAKSIIDLYFNPPV